MRTSKLFLLTALLFAVPALGQSVYVKEGGTLIEASAGYVMLGGSLHSVVHAKGGEDPEPPALLLEDTFTAANGTTLSSHTGESGGGWGGALYIYNGAVALPPTASAFTSYTSESDVDVTEDVYAVEVDFVFSGAGKPTLSLAEVGLFVDTDNNIVFSYSSSSEGWSLRARVDGDLGPAYTASDPWPSEPTIKTVRLEVTETTMRLLVDGVEVIDPKASAPASGAHVRLRLFGSGEQGAGTIIALDNLTVEAL